MAYPVPYGSEIGVQLTSIEHGVAKAHIGADQVFSASAATQMMFRPLGAGTVRVTLMVGRQGSGARRAVVKVVVKAGAESRLVTELELNETEPAASFELDVRAPAEGGT